MTEGEIRLSVSLIFLTWVGVYVDAYAFIRTHTHTAHGVLDMSPEVRMRHLEGPKNLDGLNLGIYVFVDVYKVHMCIYMIGGGTRSWTKYFLSLTCFSFRKRRSRDVNVKPRTQIRAT